MQDGQYVGNVYPVSVEWVALASVGGYGKVVLLCAKNAEEDKVLLAFVREEAELLVKQVGATLDDMTNFATEGFSP